MWILWFRQLRTTDLLNGVYILWYFNWSLVFFGHVLHVDNTVRRQLGLKAILCDVLMRWRHCTVPGVLSVGSVGSGSFPPALGAETLPRRVTIISTGILTQQFLLGNSDPPLFIRRRPHSRAFLMNSYWSGAIGKSQIPPLTPSFFLSLFLRASPPRLAHGRHSLEDAVKEGVEKHYSQFTTLRYILYNNTLQMVHEEQSVGKLISRINTFYSLGGSELTWLTV